MKKIYKVMDRDEVLCYVVDKGKIGSWNPVYRIWKCENGRMMEGGYYYPHVCREMTKDEGLYITKVDKIKKIKGDKMGIMGILGIFRIDDNEIFREINRLMKGE